MDGLVERARARLRLRRARPRADGRPGRPRDAARRCAARRWWCPTACRSCGPPTCSASSSSDRVYGPELMLRYSERCAERGHRVWLYGGRDQGSLVQLALSLRRRHPGIQIVGGYSPPFRAADARRRRTRSSEQINEARAGRALGRHRRAQAGEVDGAHARPARRAGDVRRRRRLRLPRRPHLDGAAPGCRSAGSSGSTGSRRSRAACCRATSTPTRASCSSFARQYLAERDAGCA